MKTLFPITFEAIRNISTLAYITIENNHCTAIPDGYIPRISRFVIPAF